ncbi:lipase 1-like [Galleria mellonella]|uniref:Lipase n=1 Tax=Galleria mellonella TaxID=7137 RepID=A0ABM3MG99_GALME|nr:lipase 1-like [Galleria mellonella]
MTLIKKLLLVTFGVYSLSDVVTSETFIFDSLLGKLNDIPQYAATLGKLNFTELMEKYSLLPSNISEDGKRNFTELANAYGHQCEEYNVTTEDGYVLNIFHIPGKGRPYLLNHGLVASSDCFALRKNNSLAFILAAKGHDVWIGNTRGNDYSLSHIKLDAHKDTEYWNFSLHENGYYDYPAFIDFILKETGQEKVTIIGHSQGTINTFVLGSVRPEYNDKINLFVALAPVAYFKPKGILRSIIDIVPANMVYSELKELGIVQFYGDRVIRKFIQSLCTQKTGSYEICWETSIFPFIGNDAESYEQEFSNVLAGHFPQTIPTKTVCHFAQFTKRNKFAQFDYGTAENVIRYGATTPPEYDLSNVTMKVALFVGANDYMATIEGADKIKAKLPNVVEYEILPRKQFNHFDFIFGNRVQENFYPYLFDVLDKYP